MDKTLLVLLSIAALTYVVTVNLVVNFYDDNPKNMQWEDREEYNRQFIAQLSFDNYSAEQILEELGGPDITEATQIKDTYYQVMFYRTQHVKSDSITSQDECSYLLFRNGKLVKTGQGVQYPKNWKILNKLTIKHNYQ